MGYDRFDIVVVPFPFTDKAETKRRPALVLSRYESFGRKAGHSVMAMITSAKNPPWPLDTQITDLDAAGLPVASVIRMKLFTLDHRFVLGKRGELAAKDRKAVSRALAVLLGG
ncbi:MAG TPA: type II toxin-antitoxin system PemK/MazF family toxin [Gammaproteobacteria bacterium]|nr:type II toxin-antitoxin system PemK/MazF family toxin [Gammaproteobacteria bacterium]